MKANSSLYFLVLAGLVIVTGICQSTPVAAQEGAAELTLDEIVVRARKRDERLSDIPSAISVLTDADRDVLVLDDMADYLRQLPGVILVSAGPQYLSDISIRGQGGGRLGFSESATGIYRNGLYIGGGGFGGRSLSRMDFFDMESFEVYKGPQGALYGRNAVGGAVNVVSKRPSNQLEGWAKLGFDNYERSIVEGVVNAPIIDDRLALRFGGYWQEQDGGQITDINTGATLDRGEQKGARLSVEARPTDSLTIALTAEYRESEAAAFSSLGFREFRTDGAALDPSRFERDVSTDGRVEIEESAIYLEIDWQTAVGDLHAGFSYKNRDGARIADDFDHFIGWQNRAFGGVSVDLLSDQVEDFSRLGGDIYLASRDDASRWNWLLGIEFQSFDDDVETIISGNGVVGGLNNLRRTDTSNDELASLAVFGSADVDLTDRWNLALEARVQKDSKDFTFDRVPETAPTGALAIVDEKDWTRTTPGATLSYKMSDAHLVYGRIATGYRPGGFNTGIPTDIAGAGNLIAYEPEYTKSAELGWKGPLFGRAIRADVAVYYAQTEDVQAVTAPSLTTNGFILQNAGDNDTWGVEFQARGSFEVGPGKLRFTLGLAANDGEWNTGSAVISGGEDIDISGARINRTRDLIANLNLAYTYSLSESLRAAISVGYQHEDGGVENVTGTRELESYDLFDARVSLAAERWNVSIYGKNLTDNIYRLQQVNLNNYFNQRRVWGGTVTYSF